MRVQVSVYVPTDVLPVPTVRFQLPLHCRHADAGAVINDPIHWVKKLGSSSIGVKNDRKTADQHHHHHWPSCTESLMLCSRHFVGYTPRRCSRKMFDSSWLG